MSLLEEGGVCVCALYSVSSGCDLHYCWCVHMLQVNAVMGGLFTSDIMEAAAKAKDVCDITITSSCIVSG